MEWAKKWGNWFLQTAQLVGIPTALYLLVLAGQTGAAVAGCSFSESWCDKGKDAVESAMQTLLDAYPGYDVSLKKLK